jgi:hypothetical protein
VSEEEITDLDIVLARGGWLEIDAGVAPDVELRAELEPDADDEPIRSTGPGLMTAVEVSSQPPLWFDRTGRSHLLRPGGYLLRLHADGHRSEERRVEVRPGQVTRIALTLLPE